MVILGEKRGKLYPSEELFRARDVPSGKRLSEPKKLLENSQSYTIINIEVPFAPGVEIYPQTHSLSFPLSLPLTHSLSTQKNTHTHAHIHTHNGVGYTSVDAMICCS